MVHVLLLPIAMIMQLSATKRIAHVKPDIPPSTYSTNAGKVFEPGNIAEPFKYILYFQDDNKYRKKKLQARFD